MTLWPCHVCGAPGVRNLGNQGLCDACLNDTLDKFHTRRLHGFGVRCGLVREEFGPGHCDLMCSACQATWVGLPGEPCRWCERGRQVVDKWQRELLLEPPDCDPKDDSYEARMAAWGERLRRGVEAGILDRSTARAAWKKAVDRAAA